MNKERVIKESKDHLEYVHESLRRAFNQGSESEKVFIDEVIKNIETDVKQLEMLEDMMKVWKINKGKKNLESTIED